MPSISMPLQPTPLFTGREDILSKLENYFILRQPLVDIKKQHVFVLHGLGGAACREDSNCIEVC
jgi:hypothetical protein